MLEVTLNETKIVKDALNGKYDSKNIVVTLQLLLKYYYIGGMVDELQLREQLLNFLKNHYKGYKRAKWEDTIIKIVRRFLITVKRNKIEVKLIDIDKITVTKDELEKIKALEKIELEKIAFIMLVYAKISNIVMDNDKGWINKSCSTILKEAKVNLKGTEKERIFNELYSRGYIEQRKHNAKTNMRVCYINSDSDVEIKVEDFSGVIYQYLIWKGENWKKCEVGDCNKWFIQKSKKPIRYCRLCARKIQQEQKNRWKRDKWDKEEI